MTYENSNSSGTAPGAAGEVFALTDEQIVGLGAGTDERSRQDAGATRAGAEEEGAQSLRHSGEAGMTVPPEAPAWLAERMRDPWHGDEAKELWDGKQRAEAQAAAYREVFATAEDARALKEIYPGGVAEARSAAERARELDAIDAAFYRGDAAARTQLAERMMREDPGAFREMVEAGLRLLGGDVESSKLKVGREDKGFTAEAQRPAEIRGEEKSRSLRPEGLSYAARDDSNTNVLRDGEGGREAQLGRAVPEEVARAYGEFEKTANAELEKSVGGAIARMMEQALPNLRVSGAGGREGAQGAAPLQERLTAVVREEVEAGLKSDRQLGEQVARILAGRRFDAESKTQVVRLIDARAQELVPGAVRRVVGSWTQATLGARGKTGNGERPKEVTESARRAETERNKMRAENARKETARSLEEVPARRMRRVDYGRLSDEEILGM